MVLSRGIGYISSVRVCGLYGESRNGMSTYQGSSSVTERTSKKLESVVRNDCVRQALCWELELLEPDARAHVKP